MMTSPNSPSGWHTWVPDDHPAAALLCAKAVRERCSAVMAWIEQGGSQFFTWHPEKLESTAAYVVTTIRQQYPDLQVSYHSRWRHFESGGVDRWKQLAQRTAALNQDREERGRVRIDLAIISVLLDAGAGPAWRFRDTSNGITLSRSEGLGVASFELFTSGKLSADSRHPLRSDAQALSEITPDLIAKAFQVGDGNPLVGTEGRAQILQRLGDVAQATPAVFGSPARLGNLFDYLKARSNNGRIEAAFVLETLLRALGPVWPSRLSLDGIPLGDCWQHPAMTDGFVPFHKLTQWLTYSLLEPLEDAGLNVVGLDALTGLPEYRNGGLLLDAGLLVPREPSLWTQYWIVDDLAIVEWRAATVIALDKLAIEVRKQLGLSEAAFPLARVLEGGTWAAGRRIALERRSGGGPPLHIVSDGTVF